MPDKWDFVRSWLAFSCECHEPQSSTPASVDRRDSNTCIAPASPPLSTRPERVPQSPSKYPPLKRKRHASSNSYKCDIMPSPRKRTRTQDDQLSITTTTSAFSDLQLPPTTHSRFSSLAKVRANSPVRELREIYRFATPPLKYTTSADENTPQSVLDMLHRLPLHGVGVIPDSLKVR
jgi:hypothetical protein